MPTPVEILFDASSIDVVRAQVLGLIPIIDRVAKANANSMRGAARESVRANADAGKEIARDAEKAEKTRTKLARDESKQRERIAQDAQKAELNFIKAGQSAIAAAEKERTRDAEREARNRKRIADQEARDADAALTRRSRMFGNVMGGSAGRVMGMAGRAIGLASTIGGGFAIGDALSTGISEEKQAGIIFRGAADKGRFTSAKQIQELASGTAIATGNTKTDIQGGIDQFVRKTGDLSVLDRMLNPMAKLSTATGTDFGDLGSTTAEVFNSLKNVGRQGETMSVIRALVGQGMAGAIDIKDLGQYGGRLAAGAAQFGGDIGANIESFGAIAQLAKKLGGATDTAEATEAAARLGSDFSKNEQGFKDLGVDVFTDKSKTKFRSAEDVITESVVKSGGNLSVLRELFGERSIKAAIGAQVAFSNAGGGAAGEAAIRGQFRELKSNTPTEGQIDKQAAEAMQETGRRINAALGQFNNAVNTQLLPIIPQLVDKFTLLIPHIESFLQFLVSDPWKGVGVIVATAFAAEVTGALATKGLTAGFTLIAEKVLGLFSSQKTAIANITAAVVNVNGVSSGSGGAQKVVEEVAKPVAGAAGSAGVMGGGLSIPVAAGTIGVAGVAAVNAIGMAPAAAMLYGENNKAARGAALAENVLGEAADTPEARKSKLHDIQELIARIEASKQNIEVGAGGDPTIRRGRVANIRDSEAEGASGKLAELKTTAEELTKALTAATTGAQAMSEAMGGVERRDVPTGHWPNTPP